MKVTEAKSWLLREAAKRGADVEVLATRDDRLSVEAEAGRTTNITSSSRGGVGVRAVVDGRVGYASTEELSEEALAWVLDEAIENAMLQPPSQAALPVGQALGRHDLLSEGLSAPLEAKSAAATQLEGVLAADPRVQAVQFARYMEMAQEVEVGSTKGVEGGYRNGIPILLAALVMRDGASVKQGYEYSVKPDFYQLEPGVTAQTALRRVGRHLGAKPLVTGRRRAVFEPEVVSDLLGLLAFALSAKSVVEGKSGLGGKRGERIASELITLVDDATLPGGMGSRPFDSEGTPARRLTLIEAGVLRSFLHNSDTARRLGQVNTGHASRSYASTLSVSPTNLILEAGSGIPAGDGILVTDLMGLHAGANPITGDVSLQAMGMEMRGGEQSPVDDFAISFNLFELLEQIEAVGDDPAWLPSFQGGFFYVPSLSVADLSFAGK